MEVGQVLIIYWSWSSSCIRRYLYIESFNPEWCFSIWSLSVISFPMSSCSSLGFGGFLCSVTCPLAGIGSRGASRILFWILSLSVNYFPMGSCSSLGFGYFTCFEDFPLVGIRSRGASSILFWIWTISLFSFPMGSFYSMEFGGLIILPLVHYMGSVLGVHQRFPFDLDTLVFPPLLLLPVTH